MSPSLVASESPPEAIIVVPPKPIFQRNRQVFAAKTLGAKAVTPTNFQEKIPSWNTSGKPSNPKTGTIGFNIDTNSIEYWTGTHWMQLPMRRVE